MFSGTVPIDVCVYAMAEKPGHTHSHGYAPHIIVFSYGHNKTCCLFYVDFIENIPYFPLEKSALFIYVVLYVGDIAVAVVVVVVFAVY